MKTAYIQAASTGDERGIRAVSDYFDWVNARVRLAEKSGWTRSPVTSMRC